MNAISTRQGELEVTIAGVSQIARAGLVAIVPASVRHSVKAITNGRAIIIDLSARHDFDQAPASPVICPPLGR